MSQQHQEHQEGQGKESGDIGFCSKDFNLVDYQIGAARQSLSNSESESGSDSDSDGDGNEHCQQNKTSLANYQEYFSKGDMANITTLMDPSFLYVTTVQPNQDGQWVTKTVGREGFPKHYAAINAQLEKMAGLPPGGQLNIGPEKTVTTRLGDLLLASFSTTGNGQFGNIGHQLYRDGKVLWHCGLNVPPGEEGDTHCIRKSPLFLILGPNLPKMEDFSNKENYRGYRIWNMGWQDGDVELIMTVLSKKFKLMNTSERENQPSVAVNKDLFPWAYAKFRDQMEANGGPAASDNSYRKRKKTIFKEWGEYTFVTEEFGNPIMTGFAHHAFKNGLCLWSKSLLTPKEDAMLM